MPLNMKELHAFKAAVSVYELMWYIVPEDLNVQGVNIKCIGN